MLTSHDLAERDDIQHGNLIFSPSRRQVTGPQGTVNLEPRVMQVLTCLIDTPGKVVTRDELFEACWGGVMVGEDSINRAIAKIRKAIGQVAPGEVEIRTIPRTGYILTFEPDRSSHDVFFRYDRRSALLAFLAAAATGAGSLYFFTRADQPDPSADAILRKVERALRDGYPGSAHEAVTQLAPLVEHNPTSARVQGLLALAYRDLAEVSQPTDVEVAIANGIDAADTALSIEPREANALTALATIRPEFGNWGEVEGALRRVLSIDGKNIAALNYLTMLLQSVGRARESWDLNEAVVALDPLSPVPQYRRALKHWIFGRNEAAYLAIDRAHQSWPRHPAVSSSLLYIYTFSGRAQDAARMLREPEMQLPGFSGPVHDLWQATTKAATSGSAPDIANAREVIFSIVPLAPSYATMGIMALSHLGDIDAAFDVAEGALLRKGPLTARMWEKRGGPSIADHYWRRTMNLFTPATRPMRIDSRFEPLCDGVGLSRYWSSRRIRPDAFLMS